MKNLAIALLVCISFPCGVRSQVTVSVGETAYIGSFVLPMRHGICRFGEDPTIAMTGRTSVGGSAGFFSYQQESDSSISVYFGSSIPGDYYDSSIIDFTYYCFSDSRSDQSGSMVLVSRATAVPDSQIRIRPRSWIVPLYFDSVLLVWKGSFHPLFQNDSTVDCTLSSFGLKLDSSSANKIQMIVLDSGVAIQSRFLATGMSDTNIVLQFTSSLGSTLGDIQDVATALLTVVHTPQGDSTFSNQITLRHWTPAVNSRMVLPPDSTIFTTHSMEGAEKFFTVHCDPRLTSFTMSDVNYPFHLRIADSTRDSIRVGVRIEPTTGATYGDVFTMSWELGDFQGNEHPGSAKHYIKVAVDSKGEPSFWQPAGFTNNIRPDAFLFMGDAIYGYGPGVYRLRRDSTTWRTLLGDSYSIVKLIKSKSGHLVASGQNWYNSTDAGDTWRAIHGDDFGHLAWTDFHNAPYDDPLATVGPQYGPDGKLYMAGSLYVQIYAQGPPHFESRTRLACLPDSGGLWTSIFDSFSSTGNYGTMWSGTLTDSSARVLLSGNPVFGIPFPRLNDTIFGPLPPGDIVSFYPNGDYFSGYTNGGVTSSRGAHGLPLAGIQGTAIAPNEDLYAVTGWGVYRSTDTGQTWHGLNVGLDNLTVWRIVIDPYGYAYVYSNSGWFRSVERFGHVASVRSAGSVTGLRVFPNPAASRCSIESPTPISNIKLVDCTGRIVITENQRPATTLATINLNSFASGLYLIVVQDEFGTHVSHLSIDR